MRAACFVLIAALVFPPAARADVPQKSRGQAERGVAPVAPGQEERPPDSPQTVVVTSPRATDVVVTQQYPCRIRAQRHIELKALQEGYLEAIPVREGQAVKKGDDLFRVIPILYRARWEVEKAEVQVAQIEFDNTRKLFDQKLVNQQEVALFQAKLARAQARARLAEAELNFTTIRAPFDGLLGRLGTQEGSLIKRDETLTTLSDNGVMWVYFQVSEARYIEYLRRQGNRKDLSRLQLVDSRIELVLADGSTFDQNPGNVVTVEAKFNIESGTISLRVDFPNPDRLLRHDQTGTVAIRRAVKNATVIPQRATFEVLDRRCVYVVGKDNVVRLREIAVEHEADGVFVVKEGLGLTDKIVLEGVQRVRDGDKVEYEFRRPEDAVGSPKSGREK
jgi:membrane fusion protein (multidrug efflux system)